MAETVRKFTGLETALGYSLSLNLVLIPLLIAIAGESNGWWAREHAEFIVAAGGAVGAGGAVYTTQRALGD